MFANIIGILRGERFGQASDRILGVEAHYDTVQGSPGSLRHNHVICQCSHIL